MIAIILSTPHAETTMKSTYNPSLVRTMLLTRSRLEAETDPARAVEIRQELDLVEEAMMDQGWKNAETIEELAAIAAMK